MFSAEKLTALKSRLHTLLKLYIEKSKLTLAERLTMLMGALLLSIVCMLLGIIGLVFISGALIELFSMCLHPIAAWAIVGGIYFLLLGLIVLFRQPLIFNPVARFVSQLIFKEDGIDDSEENN